MFKAMNFPVIPAKALLANPGRSDYALDAPGYDEDEPE